jgi:hypothetical protein
MRIVLLLMVLASLTSVAGCTVWKADTTGHTESKEAQHYSTFKFYPMAGRPYYSTELTP